MASRLGFLALVLLAALACGNTSGLPVAGIENVVDTVSLFALDGTPISEPSGYQISIPPPTRVRTDQSTTFDFVFNITPAGKTVVLPTGALHLGTGSGIQLQSRTFDAITTAPGGAYVDSLPVSVDSGSVFVVHSRATSCLLTATVVFFYGKFQVLAIDTVARRIDLKGLVDQNCGYRGLAPGIPKQ